MDKTIEEYINNNSWRLKSNANHNRSFSGLQSHIAGTALAKHALGHLGKIGRKHLDGAYHIHNLEAGIFGRYCNGNSALDLLQRGLINIGGVNAKPAQHFSTALNQISNFTYLMTGEFAGAQAWRDLDVLLAPYIFKDNLSYDVVKQELQEFIWDLNFNMRPGFQTPFVNLSVGLRPSKYYENLPVLAGDIIPDVHYADFQDEIDLFNRAFFDILIESPDGISPFVFPMPTINITKDFKWDGEISDKIFELASKWGTPYFSNYINTDLSEEDALSMCPLSGTEKILFKSDRYNRFEYSEIRNLKNEDYEIYSDGKFVKGKFSKYENQSMVKITLANNHTIEMSTEHLNLIKRNKNSEIETIKASNINTEMYLPYSLNVYKGDGGNRDFGYFVGAFAGDGSFNEDTGVIFSLCRDGIKNEKCVSELIRISKHYFGANANLFPDPETRLLTLKIYSKALVGMCKEFVNDIKREKHYTPKVYEMSEEFRNGVIEGHLDTDGGNRHRIYTSSVQMMHSLNMLAATLGTTTAIYKDERDNRLGKEPNYAVLIYQLNRDFCGDIWFKSENKLWIKIKSIEPISKSTAYCFEVLDDEPIFTVGTTGILTHNCRLKLNLKDVQKFSGGIWSLGNNTGSLAVFTINMSRIGYMSNGNENKFYKILDSVLEDGKEYLIKKKQYIKEGSEKRLFPMTDVYVGEKLNRSYFLTIGHNGLNECSINFCGKNIIENADWCEEVLKYMAKRILEFQQQTGQLFNFEAVPGEGCSASLARIDREKFPDIFTQGTQDEPYYTGSSLIPSNIEISLPDAIRHQEKLQRHYTGGTIFHIDTGEMASAKAVKNIIRSTLTNSTLPYATWSPTYTDCPTHGKRQDGKGCGCEKSTTWSRVVGYYRSVERWNVGKRKEFSEKKFLKV